MPPDKQRRVMVFSLWNRMLIVALMPMILALAGCSAPPDEQALRAQVAALESAIEDGKAEAVMEAVAEDFVGDQGMDRDGLRRLVVASMLGNRRIAAQTGPLEVRLQGDTARVSFSAAVTGSANWIPERGQVYQVESDWRVEDGEWKLIAARWE